MSLKIPWLERNHRDAVLLIVSTAAALGGEHSQCILNVCVRLSLQISLSYAIFIIMIFLSLLLSISAAFAVDICIVGICMPHQVPKA